MNIRIALPAITHNPWHPAYSLTSEAQHRVSSEIAHELLNEQRELHPGARIYISIGGEPYAGHVPA